MRRGPFGARVAPRRPRRSCTMDTFRLLPASGPRAHRRRGAALVEFALISFAFVGVLGGIVELGRMMHMKQVATQVARVHAREMATQDAPATATFSEALLLARVRERVYDPRLLAIDATQGLPDTANWPATNKVMSQLYIVTRLPDGRSIWHWPGTIVALPDGALTVRVPVVSTTSSGESVEWRDPIEEVKFAGSSEGPYSVLANGPQRGLVSVRVNAPYSSIFWFATTTGGYDGLVDAEAPVAQTNALGGTAVVGVPGPYGGALGLGQAYALGESVRPYRRLILGQAMHRREVLGR